MSGITATRSTAIAFCLICCFTQTGALGQSYGDSDGDGDVDGDDFFNWAGCMTGPGGASPGPECDALDADLEDGPDGRIDMADLWAFQQAPTAAGGCTPGGWYANAQVQVLTADLKGVSAKIRTRGNITLCGEPTSTKKAFSAAWTGVTLYQFAGNPPVLTATKWAQLGYLRKRRIDAELPTPSVQYKGFIEIQSGPGPAVPTNPNFHREYYPPPLSGTHRYTCFLLNSFSGIWKFEFNDLEFDTYTHQGWVGVTGNVYEYNAEVFNKEDQMVGTPGQKCDFTQCKYTLTYGAVNTNANLTMQNLSPQQSADFGIELVSPTAFNVWDKVVP